ncbi:MAG: deoxynucleoside kinase [Bacteroidota bacterium]
MQRDVHYIAIEGVIGAGKTSLTRLLHERLGGQLVLEKFEENPFLERFYQNPERFAFQTQLFFLLTRYKQLQALSQQELFDEFLITDYVFEKDKIFAHLNLQDDELHLYDQLAANMEKNLAKPDLVVYLQSSVDRLMQNIKIRGRDIERSMSRKYISDLNDSYNYFFFRYKTTPLLIVNATEIDFVKHEDHLDELIREILKPTHVAVEYYTPMSRLSRDS